MISETMFLQRKQEILKQAKEATESTHVVWQGFFLLAVFAEAVIFGTCCFGLSEWGALLWPIGCYSLISCIMVIIKTIQRFPFQMEILELEKQTEKARLEE